MPVGVSITVDYFGAFDTPHYSARHALIYDSGTIRVEPYVGALASDFRDASEPAPDRADDEQ